MPGPPGSDPYSTGDPGEGDDFPIEWEDFLPPTGCLPLPSAPHEETDSVIGRPLTLGPGESATLSVVARAWGGCSTGDCGELTVVGNAIPGLVVSMHVLVEPLDDVSVAEDVLHLGLGAEPGREGI